LTVSEISLPNAEYRKMTKRPRFWAGQEPLQGLEWR
jgi:hypothetical protein